MDNAPLTLAHTHARNASLETQKANLPAACEEHQQAAAEFANAAKEATDSEALRLLKLMEEHHQRLARIVKTQYTKKTSSPTATAENKTAESSQSTEAAPSSPPATTSSGPAPPPLPASQGNATQPAKRPPREPVSSSIASNLASARGIPSTQQRKRTPGSPTPSTTGRQGSRQTSPEARHRPSRLALQEGMREPAAPRSPRLPTETPSEALKARQEKEAERTAGAEVALSTNTTNERFKNFYTTFESYLSKLPAPLAFTSLPLNPLPQKSDSDTAPSKSPPQPPEPSKKPLPQPLPTDPTTTTPSIEVNKLISRAAYRALPQFLGTESFYVVPTTGGTTSYAAILTREQQEAAAAAQIQRAGGHHLPDVPEAGDEDAASGMGSDEFVDAREQPGPPSPLRHSRQPSGASATGAGGTGESRRFSRGLANGRREVVSARSRKTMEELEMDNEALRRALNKTTQRLHDFENAAQQQGAMLTESIAYALRRRETSDLSGMVPNSQPGSPEREKTEAQAQGQVLVQANKAEDERVKALEEKMEEMMKRLEKKDKETEKQKEIIGKYRERWEQLKEGARIRREQSGNQLKERKREDEKELGQVVSPS